MSNFGGPVINNLNHILGTLDYSSADTEIPSHATYIDTLSLECKLPSAKEHFTVFSLNIQSINAKFDYLSALVNDLSGKGIGFSAICLQESWLSKKEDVNFFKIPNYNIIHHGKTCSGHGGLFTWKLRMEGYTITWTKWHMGGTLHRYIRWHWVTYTDRRNVTTMTKLYPRSSMN